MFLFLENKYGMGCYLMAIDIFWPQKCNHATRRKTKHRVNSVKFCALVKNYGGGFSIRICARGLEMHITHQHTPCTSFMNTAH